MTNQTTANEPLDLDREQAARLGWFVAAFLTPGGEWQDDTPPERFAESIKMRVAALITPSAEARAAERSSR